MRKQTPQSITWLLGIYVVLMVLLVTTVAAAYFPLGPLSLLISLSIAAAKATLVVLYFMHVRYASRVTWLFVGAGLLWLSILLTLTLGEYVGRARLSRTTSLTTNHLPLNSTLAKTASEDNGTVP